MTINEFNHASLAVGYELSEDFDSDKFIKMRLRVCHDGTNPNGSHFELDSISAAENTIKNIPILANIIFDDDGQPQFGGHDFSIEKDKVNDGEYKTIYKEVPIGVIPETNNYEVAEFDGRNYVFVDGYIWRGYSNYAEDIIKRDNDIKLSMEVTIDEFSFNAKEKVYNVTGYRYTGITFLNKKFGTGMKNALATTGMFSEDRTEQMLMIMRELNSTLVCYKEKTKEGGTNMDTENTAVAAMENTPDDYILTFKISHEDIKYSLYSILDQKSENGWCFIEAVYDDCFDYCGSDNKLMRQKYNITGDNVEFIDEPFEVYKEILSAEEKAALESMRSEFTVMETELNELREFKAVTVKNAADAARSEIIDKWSTLLKNNEQFEVLKTERENYSAEELDTKCKCIYADSKAVFTFSGIRNAENEVTTKSTTKEDMVRIPVFAETEVKADPYGGLFAEFGIKQ